MEEKDIQEFTRAYHIIVNGLGVILMVNADVYFFVSIDTIMHVLAMGYVQFSSVNKKVTKDLFEYTWRIASTRLDTIH